jgi:hypothetical protein
LIFRKKSKAESAAPKTLTPVSKLDVLPIQGTVLSVHAEVFRSPFLGSPFGDRESRLHLTITNAGEIDTKNLAVEATTPIGTELIDPGALFGNSRRFVRMPPLAPQKKITYKLGIRVSESFDAGDLIVRISTVSVGKSKEFHEVSIPLQAFSSN